MASHPSQPAITTYMFWIVPLEKIFAKEWQVTLFNRICDTFILENWTSRESSIASHPSQPQFTTHIFSKIEHLEKNSSEDWKSPKSTGKCNIHILENRNLSQISWRESTSQPSQPALTTHIFSKLVLSRNCFARNG